MSKLEAIKTFRDLLAFLTIIPVGKTEDFVSTSARRMYLFPLMGALIGILGAGYFLCCGVVVSYLASAANFVFHIPTELLQSALPPAMTLAFLLVLTGFQHFDGLIDLGNAIGLKRVEDRREIAHRWVVTYKGALLAICVEFSAFAGLFFLRGSAAVATLIVAEVAAKLAMVTIVWVGEAAHQGLGSRFISQARRNRNIVGYITSFAIGFFLLGLAGLLAVAIVVFFGLFMESVAKSVFGGVSGDMIGATNEAARTLTLAIIAVSLAALPVLSFGAFGL
jgi:adenosylcobinamide-GDP ribazoletransferase